MLSQARQHPPFPTENPSLGADRAPLIMNVPVAYYTAIFRPQFYGFFLFDFTRGFSFYWCLKFFGLLVAAGWCLRQIGVRSRLLVVFGAIWVAFSSYVQWWFSSPVMLPEMLASWFVCLGCAVTLFQERGIGKTILALAAFIFFGINFILCLYPPYQIPLVLLFVALLIGTWRETRTETDAIPSVRALTLILAGLIGIVLLLVPFWIDAKSTLNAVSHTVYPGARRSSGGDLSFFKLFSGLLGFFEYEEGRPVAYANISEASNFYLLWPAAAFVVIAARWRTKIRISPVLLALLIFLVGLSLYCVLPLPDLVLRASFLSFATERRALLSLGIANIVFCCLFLDKYRGAILSKITAISGGLLLWLGVVVALWSGRSGNAAYFADLSHWIVSLGIAAVVLFLWFYERLRYRWFPVLFGWLLIMSNAPINPLMRGLSPLLDSVAYQAVDQVRATHPDSKWIIYHSRYFAQLVKATGAVTFNGTKVVPDLSLMDQIDPNRSAESVYNRYANIDCEMPRSDNEVSALLVDPDFYLWYLPPDLPPLKRAGFDCLLIAKEWPEAARYGFGLVGKVSPGDLWIYRRE